MAPTPDSTVLEGLPVPPCAPKMRMLLPTAEPTAFMTAALPPGPGSGATGAWLPTPFMREEKVAACAAGVSSL